MVWRWGKREIIYLSLHCHYLNDFCIKVGSDESHFNVSLTVGDKVTIKTVSTNHNLFEEKGEPKRYRIDVLLLTSLPPYRWAKLDHHCCFCLFYGMHAANKREQKRKRKLVDRFPPAQSGTRMNLR